MNLREIFCIGLVSLCVVPDAFVLLNHYRIIGDLGDPRNDQLAGGNVFSVTPKKMLDDVKLVLNPHPVRISVDAPALPAKLKLSSRTVKRDSALPLVLTPVEVLDGYLSGKLPNTT